MADDAPPRDVPPPPARAPRPPAPAGRPRGARLWRWALALPLLAVLAALAGAWHALHTETGTRWWLRQAALYVPGLSLDEPGGALLGAEARFSLARLALRVGATTVQVDGLRIDGLTLGDWQAVAPFAHLHAGAVTAARVALGTAPDAPPSPPATLPTRLPLPLSLRIDAVRVDRLLLPGLAVPVEGLSARLASDAAGGHRVDALQLRWNGLAAEGAAQLGVEAPLPLQARLALHADPSAQASQVPAWAHDVTLALQAHGPLSRFDTQATVVMQSQRVDVRAQVTPFETLPVSQLDARFAQLDLARLLAPFDAAGTVPTTALDGNALLQLDRDAPLVVRAQIHNALPGSWDRRRAPLRDLDLLVNGRGAMWQIERARLQLAGDERTPAGRIDAQGQVDGQRADLRLQLADVLLQGLDGRAPPLRLAGQVQVGHAPAAADATAPFGTVTVDARLDGALLGAPRRQAPAPLRQRVTLALRGSATPSLVVLDTATVQAGAARLNAQGRARRDGAAWQTEADLTLAGFDLTQWLPGEASSGWRRGRNALNGHARLSARLPAAVPRAADWLAALRGTLDAELADSAFGGQPLAGSLQAAADGAGQLEATARARAADNEARLSLRLRTATGDAASARGDERLALTVDAPALGQLAPLAEALGLGAPGGSAQLDTQADGALGAWLLGRPAGDALHTRGQLTLRSLQLGRTRLASADAQWDATLPGDAAGRTLAQAAMQAQARATGLELPGLQVPTASLQADGTLADHRATLQAGLRQLTAPAREGGGNDPAPLQLQVRLTGAWQPGDGGAPNRWRLRLPELTLLPVPAAPHDAPAAAATGAAAVAAEAAAPLPLVQARDLALELQQSPGHLRWEAAPGSAEVLGAVLRWRTLTGEQRGDETAQLAVQAEIEPFDVARLLRRLQPDFGWTGDLRVGARIDVRSDPTVKAQIEIARTGGDLQVDEFGSITALDLTEARLAFTADDGVWRFTQLVAGSNLGRVVGSQTVRTDARRLWPDPQAPVEGALRVQVENLGAWGAWVPTGWRLGGQMDGTLRVGGRFGGPELIGELHGRQLALRNTLEGVSLTDGELDARFDGSTAQLTTLVFRAGSGELRASGDARLGEQPQATLTLQAKQATVLGRVDRRVVATGQARLVLDAQTTRIDGEFRADEGLVDASRSDAPALGDDVTVRRGGAAAPDDDSAATHRAPRAVDMRLTVNLGERFRLRGRGIDTRLTGELKLTTPNGKLTAYGEIRTDDGTYEAYGQKLTIERGVITFVGDVANPRLDIQAVRANADSRVGVLVGGNVGAPRVRLFSDPELPATEKLALLVTGRSYDSLGGSDTLLLQRAAFALLAGDGSEGRNPLDVAGLLQLDELSVRQNDGTVRETVVTLGKQISDRVYVGYERGLNATAGNWQLIYRIAQRFTLRAQSGEDPAVDLIWIFRWN